MVTLSEVPTITGWERSSRRRRRPSSGVWIIDDDVSHSQPTVEVPVEVARPDELETLPQGRRVRMGDDGDVVTAPMTKRSAGTPPPPRLIPIDLTEPETLPMARRPPEPVLEDDDELPTHEIPRYVALQQPEVVELMREAREEREDLAPESAEEAVFDLDSLISDVDSFESAPGFPSAAPSWPVQRDSVPVPSAGPSWPVRRESVPAPAPSSASSFPGRAFGAGLAPTSQLDRPEGPSLGARAVSVLVAVAVISLVLLAAAMIVTDKSGMAAFAELLSMLGLQ